MRYLIEHHDAVKNLAILTGGITFALFVLFAAAQQEPVTCEDCIVQEDKQLVAHPSATHTVQSMTVCTVEQCTPNTNREDVVCTADTDTCRFTAANCDTPETRQYWIHVETSQGEEDTVSDTVTVKKPDTCPCTANNECASDRCHQAVCTADTPPQLFFK